MEEGFGFSSSLLSRVDGHHEWIPTPYEIFWETQVSEPVLNLGENPNELLLGCLPMLKAIVGAAAKRWRLPKEDADDLLSEMQVKLLENDAEALRSCESRDKLRAFLATAVARQWLDRRNHEWGKWRPCAEAKRQGPDGELLDRWAHRDGLPLDQVVEKARQHGMTLSRDEIERRVALFPVRVKRRQENDESLESRPDDNASPEEALLTNERAARRELALRLVGEDLAAWPPEEVVMLRLYLHGRTITAIAAQLGVERRPVYRQFEGFFRRLKKKLEEGGIGPGEAGEILALERWEAEAPTVGLFLADEDFPDRPSETIDDFSRPKRK